MKKFFSRNIDSRGRVMRAVLGGLLIAGGVIACGYNLWLAVTLILSGGFCVFEAVRGWCFLRACGIKTKV